MQTLTTEVLKRMRMSNGSFALINVLPLKQFRVEHIPGSANIPVADDDFLKRVGQFVGDKARTIIVYCANTQCAASTTAARQLEEAGYSDVYDYKAGMKAWKESGGSVESSTND